MLHPEILTLPSICATFPQLDPHVISRENLLNTLDSLLAGEVHLLAVEGDEGVGKTHLCAQFALRHPNHSISFFSPPAGRLPLSGDLLKFDICNQLSWILTNSELENPSDASESLIRSQLFTLQRRAQRSTEQFYFIIDGFDQVATEDWPVIAQFLESLPIGLPRLKVLISAPTQELAKYFKANIKTFIVPLLSLDETSRYFSDVAISDAETKDIYSVCRGTPGYLATIKRILRSGIKCSDLIEQMPDRLPFLFELEWHRVDQSNTQQTIFLALLCFSNRPRTKEEIASILGVDENTVDKWVEDLGFIEINPRTHEAGYVSVAFKRFAARKLAYMERDVHSLLLDFLSRKPYTEEALFQIPDHLQRLGRFEDLLSHLTLANTIQMLQRSQSMALLKHNTSLGLKAASNLRHDGEVLRFSLQRSLFENLGLAQSWKAEVEARLSLNEHAAALALANLTLAKEHRLHLLVLVAKAKRDQGLTPEDTLLEQIRNLYNQVDPKQLGNQSFSLAADLLAVLPELAVDLLAQITTNPVEKKSLTSALSSDSFAAVSQAPGTPNERRIGVIKILNNRLAGTPSHIGAIAVVLKAYSAPEILSEIERIDKIDDRLHLLAQWSRKNAARTDAHSVVDHALKLALKTTAFVPTPQWLSQIATPLIHLPDNPDTHRLLGVIDAQKGSISENGPTEDLLGLHLLLTECEYRFNKSAARNRLVDAYLNISTIQPPLLRLNCFARLFGTLRKLDSDGEIEHKEGLSSLCRTEIIEGISRLLSATADQLRIFKPLIELLARADFEIALSLALRLNDEDRRNHALLCIVEELLDLPVEATLLQNLDIAIGRMTYKGTKDKAIFAIIEYLSDQESLPDHLTPEILGWLRRADNLSRLEAKCQSYCGSLAFLSKHDIPNKAELMRHLEARLEETWSRIDADWVKADIGFEITRQLAPYHLQLAHAYLSKAEAVRDTLKVPSGESVSMLIDCIRLGIRALLGLLPKRLDKTSDLSRLISLIERVPSRAHRIMLWSELSVALSLAERRDDCKRIVGEKIRPAIDSLRDDEPGAYNAVFSEVVALALYVSHKGSALAQIEGLDKPHKDHAYYNIALFIVEKVLPGDPHSNHPTEPYDLDYEDICDLLDITERICSDHLLVDPLEWISRSISSRRARKSNQFTQQQLQEIARRMMSIIDSKLPDPDGIQHEGYKLLAIGFVYRTKKEPIERWNNLIEAAQKVPNLADRALLLSIIAEMVSARNLERGKQLLKEAEIVAQELPSIVDQIRIYRSLAVAATGMNIGAYKGFIRSALSIAKTEGDNLSRRKYIVALIDFTYSLDPDLANSLTSLLDDDPARVAERTAAEERNKSHGLRKNLLSHEPFKPDDNQLDDLPEVAWELLGSLNAKRSTPLRVDRVRNLMAEAARLDLNRAYPAYAWLIQNLVDSYSTTDDAQTFIRPVLEALVVTAELIQQIDLRIDQVVRKQTSQEVGRDGFFVRSGERDAALQFLQNWIEQSASNYLKICDPYFGPRDLEVLRPVLESREHWRIEIMTSRKHQIEERLPQPWPEAYRSQWRKFFSDEEPPDVEIVIAGVDGGGELPIHDRWWLSKGCGIRVGTSFNSLGNGKDSEISLLSSAEAQNLEQEVNQYFYRLKREHRGKRIIYEIFSLLSGTSE